MLSVTLKTNKRSNPPAGFINQSLQLSRVRYHDTLQSVIDNLNQYRSPDSQINQLYNQYGGEIPKEFWGFKLKENLTIYVDK